MYNILSNFIHSVLITSVMLVCYIIILLLQLLIALLVCDTCWFWRWNWLCQFTLYVLITLIFTKPHFWPIVVIINFFIITITVYVIISLRSLSQHLSKWCYIYITKFIQLVVKILLLLIIRFVSHRTSVFISTIVLIFLITITFTTIINIVSAVVV